MWLRDASRRREISSSCCKIEPCNVGEGEFLGGNNLGRGLGRSERWERFEFDAQRVGILAARQAVWILSYGNVVPAVGDPVRGVQGFDGAYAPGAPNCLNPCGGNWVQRAGCTSREVHEQLRDGAKLTYGASSPPPGRIAPADPRRQTVYIQSYSTPQVVDREQIACRDDTSSERCNPTSSSSRIGHKHPPRYSNPDSTPQAMDALTRFADSFHHDRLCQQVDEMQSISHFLRVKKNLVHFVAIFWRDHQ